MKPSLILVGAGGHAHACIDVIELQDSYRIAGIIGMPAELHTSKLGYEVIGTDLDLPKLAKAYKYALVTVGQIHSSDVRQRLFKRINELGFLSPVIIAPTAYTSRHATIGAGTIVMHRAVVNSGVEVGRNCIINSCALLEHDVSVGDHCHISTGAILNGGTRIGECSFVGSRSVIMEGVTIGRQCIIGMGLSVRHAQPDTTRLLHADPQ